MHFLCFCTYSISRIYLRSDDHKISQLHEWAMRPKLLEVKNSAVSNTTEGEIELAKWTGQILLLDFLYLFCCYFFVLSFLFLGTSGFLPFFVHSFQLPSSQQVLCEYFSTSKKCLPCLFYDSMDFFTNK